MRVGFQCIALGLISRACVNGPNSHSYIFEFNIPFVQYCRPLDLDAVLLERGYQISNTLFQPNPLDL